LNFGFLEVGQFPSILHIAVQFHVFMHGNPTLLVLRCFIEGQAVLCVHKHVSALTFNHITQINKRYSLTHNTSFHDFY